MEKIDCLIIGSGPAGYTAAIYASRANLNPVIYVGLEPGGQLTTTTDVENFPGYPQGITGPQMMEDLKEQAARFGTQIRSGFIKEVQFSNHKGSVHVLKTDKNEYLEAKTVIIATGASAKYLGLDSETRLKGGGVSACATCDGFFYRQRDVVVVGGGDTAAEEATYLSNIAKEVHLLVRKDKLKASKVMQDRVKSRSNIKIHYNTEIQEVLGDNVVCGVRVIDNQNKEIGEIKADGVFISIGHKPNTDIFKDQITMDDAGYIKTHPGSTKTNVLGVFAAGDVQDNHYRQAITAAGTGCMAALDAERYLSEMFF